MTPTLEFATTVLDTVSFVLVTPDIFGKERVSTAGEELRKASEYFAQWGRHVPRAIGRLMDPFMFVASLVTLVALPIALFWSHLRLVDRWWVLICGLACAASVVPWLVLACLSAILAALKRYSFNGLLLGIGAAIFLVSRTLIMIAAWP